MTAQPRSLRFLGALLVWSAAALACKAAPISVPTYFDATPDAGSTDNAPTVPNSTFSFEPFTTPISPAKALTPSSIYSAEAGYGWDSAQAPKTSFSHAQFTGIRPMALCDGVSGPEITLRMNLAAGRWTVIAFLDDGYENAHTVGIETNGQKIVHNTRTFGVDAEPPQPPSNRYRVAQFILTATDGKISELRFNQSGPGGVRLLALQFLPMDWKETDVTRWLDGQLKTAGAHPFDAPIDILSSELGRRARANPDQAAVCAYWKAQIDLFAEAEHWYVKGGWDEVSASTRSSMFARYKIAVSLLDPLIDHPDGDKFPLRDRARWLRARLLFWLWAEQENDGDQNASIADLEVLHAKYPDDQLIAMYAGEKIPYDTSADIITALPNSPAWSAAQLEALERLRDIAHYWVDHRQIPNGEFGGKTDDDVELLRWWPVLMLIGDNHVRDGFSKLAECIWFSPRVYQGYSRASRDVEHSSEFVSDTIPMMALLTRDPEWIARLQWSSKYMRDLWTGKNDAGDVQFKSAWIGALDIQTEPPRNRDVALNTRATKAVRYYSWLANDAESTRMLTNWSLTWAKVAASTDKGKPRGIFPPSIRFPDAVINGDEPTWYRSNMLWDYFDWDGNGLLYDQMLFSWLSAPEGKRDARLLQPMLDTLAFLSSTTPSEIPPVTAVPVPAEGLNRSMNLQPPATAINPDEGKPSWAAARLLDNPEFWTIVTQWRLETGDSRYDTLLAKYGPPYLKYRLNGDPSLLATTIEDNMLQVIRYNRPLLTKEPLFTDRIYVSRRDTDVNADDTLAAMLTGCHSAQGLSPYYHVAWEKTPESFTALVKSTGSDHVEADIFLHQSDAAEFTVRFLRLPPGNYRLTLAANGKTISERSETIKTIDHRASIKLPGATLVTMKMVRTGAATAQAAGDNRTPTAIALGAASVILRDAEFSFENEPWSAPKGVHILDDSGKDIVAQAEITVAETGKYRLGVGGAGEVHVLIDDAEVFKWAFTPKSEPHEFAYDLFKWPADMTLQLTAGKHRMRVEARQVKGAKTANAFLQICDQHGATDARVSFGTWQKADSASAKAKFQPYTRTEVRDFVVKKDAAFKKHSLVEWHYATGVTHLALLEAADATGDKALRAHVDRFVSFTLDNLPWQRDQFQKAYAWRAANYRYFRGCLLDDTSAPALPFVELLRRGEGSKAAPVVSDILDFVLKKHPRLADGTLCRDEPEPQTVWADDLFMSTTFMIRAAAWKKDPRLYDEIVKQVEGFHKHLINPATGLYWHGYYAARSTPADFQWARANGWIAWAMSECLRYIPANHPGREKILALHKQHLATLLHCQETTGFWHQLLDHPESFEETSATAMFFIAMARGMKAGWLDRATYAEPAKHAWAALQTRIGSDNVVRGICGGTGIGDSVEYYCKRPQPNHDPRGIGAYIIAATLANDL